MMSLSLQNLKSNVGSKKKKKRVGRGNASGHGTFSTRGCKGQKSRSGGKKGLKQKGWRHLLLSTPKLRGFKSDKIKALIVNLNRINGSFSDGEKVSPRSLLEKKLISHLTKVKILGGGELTKKIEVEDCLVSKTAREKIEKLGGKIGIK